MDALHKGRLKGNIFQMMHVLNRFSTFFNIMASLFKTYRSLCTVPPSCMNGAMMLRDFVVQEFIRHGRTLVSTYAVPAV
jgi:hypothetical protein